MTTLLITGANRGIGLEHVRQALGAGETVIAACRAPAQATDLHSLVSSYGGRLSIAELDVAVGASIDALARRLEGVAVDVLINNAGVFGPLGWPEGARLQSISGMDYDLWENMLRINVLGPFRVTARLLPNLLAGQRKLVIMMSSDLGSIAKNTLGTSHAYRASKAALNMLTKGLAIELKSQGITVVSLAPGWTKTDLGGEQAHWAVDESVKAQREVLANFDLTHSGQFIDLTGKVVAW
jgi:NAD(P)-dependent dehydrogenase (short-subunit alcohol dehydrogenase family)